MVKQARQATRLRSLKAAGIVGIGVGGILVAATALAAGIIALFARTVVTPPRGRRDDIHIFGVRSIMRPGDVSPTQAVVLSATPDSEIPGTYGLWFSDASGHARVGEIVERTASTVTRQLLHCDFGDLERASRGRWSGWVFLGPWQLELEYSNVVVSTPLGSAPAWWVPAAVDSSRWAIHVHGRAVRRQECLRALPVFHDASMHSLVVSYRNDGEAPESADGRYGLGDTEWNDVAAAMEFAQQHGATEIVLMGWSMGGAIVLQAALRAELRELVTGVVLESPAVDWRDILHFHGQGYGFPTPINQAVVHTIGSRWGRAVTGLDDAIDFDRLDIAVRADAVNVPILLLHSVDDGYVPITGSRELAQARPDIVTFEEFTVARHTKLWNYDAERWNGAIRSWLEKLPNR